MDASPLAERFAQLALAAAYLAGAILAIVFWSRHPRQAQYLLIAAGLSLGVELLFIATWFVPDDDDDFFHVLNSIDSIIRLVAFALLTLAVFTGRPRAKATFMDLDDEPP